MQRLRLLLRHNMPVSPWINAAIAVGLLACAVPGWAIDDRSEVVQGRAPAPEEGTTYKFTPTVYRTTHEPLAYDLNLRGNHGPHTAWIGYYQRADEFQQLRLGYDHTLELPFGRVVPSVQYATRGFLGGSITAEIGKQYFALLGFGRTNLRDYFNLNFDPNDMVLFGAGTRALPHTTLTLFQIYDDRLGTGQRVTHLTAQVEAGEKKRWTVDVFYKEGRSSDDGQWVHGTGATLTYDFSRYFARVASDPYVNFSRDHMVRAAFGWRF